MHINTHTHIRPPSVGTTLLLLHTPLRVPVAFWCPTPHCALSFTKEKFQHPKTVRKKPPIGCRRSRTPLKSRIFAAHAVATALSLHTRCALLRPSSFKSSFSFCKIK